MRLKRPQMCRQRTMWSGSHCRIITRQRREKHFGAAFVAAPGMLTMLLLLLLLLWTFVIVINVNIVVGGGVVGCVFLLVTGRKDNAAAGLLMLDMGRIMPRIDFDFGFRHDFTHGWIEMQMMSNVHVSRTASGVRRHRRRRGGCCTMSLFQLIQGCSGQQHFLFLHQQRLHRGQLLIGRR